MAVVVKSSDVSPPSELVSFRERTKLLTGRGLTRELKDKKLQLDARSKHLLSDVEQLLRELSDFRFEHPESTELVMRLENMLLRAFPEADPDRKM